MNKKEGLENKSKILKLIGKYNNLPEISWIRTGIHALDLCIGGGIPLGRILEVYGSEGSGKSLLAWTVGRAFQNNNGVVILYDVEATTPKDFMRQVGINPELFILGEGRTVEEIREDIKEKVKEIREVNAEMPILVIWDSVAATTADGEWEDIEQGEVKNNVGARAQAMSRFFRQFTIWLSANNVTLFCVNQVRDKIGVMYGAKEDSPGGRALKFHASVRIQLNKGTQLKIDEEIIGQTAHMLVYKNKLAPNYRKVDLVIKPNAGYDNYGGLAEVLVMANRVSPERGGITIDSKKYKYNELEVAVNEHPEIIRDWIYDSGNVKKSNSD